jgi:hypothetical protein
MASDPEAQTQLARLLRDESLRAAPAGVLRDAVDARFDVLIEGIVGEALASDDVTDQASALSFVELRLQSLSSVLSEQQTSRLLQAVREKIAAW